MTLFKPDPPKQPPGPYPQCDCVAAASPPRGRVPQLHHTVQDTVCEAWSVLVQRIERAATDRATELAPLDDLDGTSRSQIVTLPRSIETLVHVRRLKLYGSHLERLPVQIGAMRSLEYLDIYTSYRLHYLPFELARCSSLKDSRMSTRALYGNYKNRCHFPDLLAPSNISALEQFRPEHCSVCDGQLSGGIAHRWITLALGTDCVPLLVFACSAACINRLPTPAEDYLQRAHVGGRSVSQPPKRS